MVESSGPEPTSSQLNDAYEQAHGAQQETCVMKGRKGKVLRWKELPVRWVA